MDDDDEQPQTVEPDNVTAACASHDGGDGDDADGAVVDEGDGPRGAGSSGVVGGRISGAARSGSRSPTGGGTGAAALGSGARAPVGGSAQGLVSPASMRPSWFCSSAPSRTPSPSLSASRGLAWPSGHAAPG